MRTGRMIPIDVVLLATVENLVQDAMLVPLVPQASAATSENVGSLGSAS